MTSVLSPKYHPSTKIASSQSAEADDDDGVGSGAFPRFVWSSILTNISGHVSAASSDYKRLA